MKTDLAATFDNRQRLMGALVLMALSCVAFSQQVVPGASALDVEEEEEIRRYSVELIIFEYVDRSTAGTEVFDPDEPPVPDVEALLYGDDALGFPIDDEQFPHDDIDAKPIFPDPSTVDLITGDQDDADGVLIADDTDVLLPGFEDIALVEISTFEQAGLKILEPEEYVLNDAYERLQTLDAYRPLLHAAWTQPTLEKDVTVPIKLRRLGDPPLRLDGTLMLYLSRFLHLVVDLELEEKAPQRIRAPDNRLRSFGDSRTRFGFDTTFETPSIFYRIEEDRIVRNGELRYYDHPRYGVLAKIARIEEAQPVDSDTDVFATPVSSSNQN